MIFDAVVFDAYGTLYDIQSVATITEECLPGYGDIITQVWRLKQLEYTWLRSLMERYENFETITRDALVFTIRSLGLTLDPSGVDRIMEKYLSLELYPDARVALDGLSGRKLAILSNGSPAMLNALVRNTGLDRILDATLSVDARAVFKPSPAAYTLIEEKLGVRPSRVLFVTANPWDASGAKSFGLNVAWIERVTPAQIARELSTPQRVAPQTVFKILRTLPDELGFAPDYRISALSDLPAIVAA